MRLSCILLLLALVQGTEVVLGPGHNFDVAIEQAALPASPSSSKAAYVGRLALGSEEFTLLLDTTVPGLHLDNSPFSPKAEPVSEHSSGYSTNGVLGLGQPMDGRMVLGHTSFMLTFGEEKKVEFRQWGDDDDMEEKEGTIQANTQGPLWEFQLEWGEFAGKLLTGKSGFIDVKSDTMQAPKGDYKVIQKAVCEDRVCTKRRERVGFACSEVPQDLPQLTFSVNGFALTLSPDEYIQASNGRCQLLITAVDNTQAWAFGQPFLAAYALQFNVPEHSITVYGEKNLRKRRSSGGADLLFLLLIVLWIVEFAIYHPWIFIITISVLTGICYCLYRYQKAKDEENALKEPLMDPTVQPAQTQGYPPGAVYPAGTAYPQQSANPYPLVDPYVPPPGNAQQPNPYPTPS